MSDASHVSHGESPAASERRRTGRGAHGARRWPTRGVAARVLAFVAPALRAPLVVKILGANGVIIALFVSVALMARVRPTSIGEAAAWAALVVVGLVVTIALVVTALRPLAALEATAHRIWAGDLLARVPESPLADRDIVRVGRTLNVVLDGLVTDRARMRQLASAVIRAGDEERAHISLELHDSTAQSLAAISWELGALARDVAGTTWEPRITAVQRRAETVLEEVRLLAQTVHPRVLDDLGLAAALGHLAREAREASGLEVVAETDPDASRALAASEVAVLYRVAQEAVANAVRHGAASTVIVRLRTSGDATLVEITDDGRGFDVIAAERHRQGMGIFTMRERMSLVGGTLDIRSDAAAGTRVRAQISNRSSQLGPSRSAT